MTTQDEPRSPETPKDPASAPNALHHDAASTGVTGETGSTLAERLTAVLAHFIVSRPRTVLALAIAATIAASTFAALRLRLDMDRNNLIGRDVEYNKRYIELEAEFGDLAAMTIVAEAPTRDRVKELADDVAAKCKARPDLFGTVFYRVPIDALSGKTLLFAQLGDLKELASTLENTQLFPRLAKGEGAGGLFAGLGAHVKAKIDAGDMDGGSNGGADMGGILYGVLDGIQAAVEKGAPYKTPWKDVVDDGYAWAKPGEVAGSPTSRYGPDGKRLLVLIQPVAHPDEIDGAAPSVRALRELLDAYRADPKWQDLKLGLTGGPVLAVDEMETYRRDATIATVVGFVAVILLFMISFRRVLGPLCAGACLAMAIAFTLAFAAAWPGHLNLISIVFLEILIGLGIDFGIHLISRYDEERTYGMAPAPALEAALGLTGRASAAGAVTTALAFMATLFAEFKGIQEFGVIAAAGIIFCLGTMLFVLPALVILIDQGKLGSTRRPRPGWARSRPAVKLDHWAIRRPVRLVLLTSLFAGGMFLVGRAWVHYSGNLLDLQATNLESVKYATDLVQGDTIANLVATTPEQLEKYAAKMRELTDVVDHVECLPVQQKEKLVEIARIRASCAQVTGDAAPLGTDPRAALAELRAGVEQFDHSLEEAQDLAIGAGRRDDVREIEKIRNRLAGLIAAADPAANDAEQRGKNLLAWEKPFRDELLGLLESLRRESARTTPVTAADLPPVLRDRFVGKTGKLLLHIYPKERIFDDAPLEKFVKRIREQTPELTGVPVQIYETGRLMKEGYQRAGYYAFIFIAVYLVVHFRSLAFAGITLAALVSGAAVGLGLLGLKGETLNPANMLAIPLTLGIGVCYAIQLVHRHRQALAKPSVAGPQPVIATSTGRGVLLSAGTNVVGFGALALAHHHGTASIGYAITFGVVGCLVTALFFLPALLRLWTGPGDFTIPNGQPGPKVGPDGKVARPSAL